MCWGALFSFLAMKVGMVEVIKEVKQHSSMARCHSKVPDLHKVLIIISLDSEPFTHFK